jgi:glycosyltransferase involved in cell wall biosynthesis
MKIGILSKNYAAQRLFLDKLSECQYKDVRFYNWCLWKNAHLWWLKAIGKLKMSPEEMVARLFYDFKPIIPTGCDVFHFFNCINLGKHTKWVISVESGVPWPVSVTRCVESEKADLSSIVHDKYVERRIKALANSNCLGLLALSHCTENIQREIIKQFPQYESIIAKKMITLLPPQKLIIGDVLEKGVTWIEEEPLTFIYVGSDFYRKGGRETVQVLSELHKRYSFKLILISSMAVDEKRYMRTENDEKESKCLIEKNKDWIEYYDRLPNTEVLEKMKKAHVCLLPTWMDTFAYSVLEAQACGTPVISTSLRALTEINNENVGWLIDVPVNRLNNPLHLTREQQDVFSEKLLNGLRDKLEYVLQHREKIKDKAMKCLVKIKEYHSPQIYEEKLRMVYQGRIGEIK